MICDAARLPDGAARTLAASLGVLLHAVADGSAEALPIDRLPVMAAAERARLLEAWNDTATAYDDRCMHTLIEAQAARTPDATAVVFEAETLTYAELDARANRVAQVLRTMGVGPDTLVGLHMPRSLEMIVGALAIHKAGGAYVPLDPGYPAERIAHYLADSAAPVVLTRSRRRAPPAGAATRRCSSSTPTRGSRRRRRSRWPRASARRTSPTSSTPRARPASPRA